MGRDPVAEPGEPALGHDLGRAQDARVVELVVIGMVEVPGQPVRQLPARDLDQPARSARAVDLHHPRIGIGIDPADILDRMLLERAEDVADRHLQFVARRHVLEQDHAVLNEQRIDPLARGRVLRGSKVQPANPHAERQAGLQGADGDFGHGILSGSGCGDRHRAELCSARACAVKRGFLS